MLSDLRDEPTEVAVRLLIPAVPASGGSRFAQILPFVATTLASTSARTLS